MEECKTDQKMFTRSTTVITLGINEHYNKTSCTFTTQKHYSN